jgi:hypothetical protein
MKGWGTVYVTVVSRRVIMEIWQVDFSFTVGVGKRNARGVLYGYMNKRGENIIEGAPYGCLGRFPEIYVRQKFYGVEVG